MCYVHANIIAVKCYLCSGGLGLHRAGVMNTTSAPQSVALPKGLNATGIRVYLPNCRASVSDVGPFKTPFHRNTQQFFRTLHYSIAPLPCRGCSSASQWQNPMPRDISEGWSSG
jgi:hypothetical protein